MPFPKIPKPGLDTKMRVKNRKTKIHMYLKIFKIIAKKKKEKRKKVKTFKCNRNNVAVQSSTT